MTKSQLIQRLAELNPHLYQRDVERIVSAVFEEITAALERGDRVELRGFGAFSVITVMRGQVGIHVQVRRCRSSARPCHSLKRASSCAI